MRGQDNEGLCGWRSAAPVVPPSSLENRVTLTFQRYVILDA